jgi:hypothetical protein
MQLSTLHTFGYQAEIKDWNPCHAGTRAVMDS